MALDNLENLELKQRTDHITDALAKFLPTDFKQAAKILSASIEYAPSKLQDYKYANQYKISGWAVICLTNYVAIYGQNHFSLSMELLKQMTKSATSEFAIRSFILTEQDKTLKVIRTWAIDENHHVRRLASEGIRPRLPWGFMLQTFVKNPEPVIAVLELLKDDKELYVRRSVANNLNDIAKDNQELVVDILKKWHKSADENRIWLIKHASRSLFKKGNKEILQLFGYYPAKLKKCKFKASFKKS